MWLRRHFPSTESVPKIVPVLSADDAQAIVLKLLDDGRPDEPSAVSRCWLSERGDFWIVCANDAEYVLRGDQSRMRTGVNAYLVDSQTGALDFAYSYETPEYHLQCLYDLREAAGRHYVLRAAFAPADKAAIVHLRMTLSCPYARARQLAEPDRPWLTGTRQDLLGVQELFTGQRIPTEIVIVDDAADARTVDRQVLWWDRLKTLMQ